MFISKHAIQRSKQRGLMPKTSKATRVKKYIRDGIKNDCEKVYWNKFTGSKVFVTKEFTAIMKRGTIVTIYPRESAATNEQVQ